MKKSPNSCDRAGLGSIQDQGLHPGLYPVRDSRRPEFGVLGPFPTASQGLHRKGEPKHRAVRSWIVHFSMASSLPSNTTLTPHTHFEVLSYMEYECVCVKLVTKIGARWYVIIGNSPVVIILIIFCLWPLHVLLNLSKWLTLGMEIVAKWAKPPCKTPTSYMKMCKFKPRLPCISNSALC